ncbi:MAG: hypothetical protein HFACDABA_02682 [Anaerolineales bacterium]|nr:hypothetical protein [Anaerolineales bacterium]
MSASAHDRAYYESGIEDLETYLLSAELYWPSRAPTPDLTQLTPGGLLLVRARLTGWKATGLDALDARLDGIRSTWRSAWNGKAQREVRARSERWRGFLSGYRDDPRGVTRLYAQHVRQRAIPALLGEVSDPMDGWLKELWRAGAFVWDMNVQDGFPQTEFWFLYGKITFEEIT